MSRAEDDLDRRPPAVTGDQRYEPSPAVPLEWTPGLAERFWRAAYRRDLPAARIPRQSARHLAAVLARRIAAGSAVATLGDRDSEYAAALLLAGFRVGRIDTGPLLRGNIPQLAEHPNWLGNFRDPPPGCDVVCMPEILVHALAGETEALFAAARSALRSGGWLVVTMPGNEPLDFSLSLCPASGVLFHKDQRVRAFTRNGLETLLQQQGFAVAGLLEAQLDEAGFQALGSNREALARATHLHFGNGGTLLALAVWDGRKRADDAAAAARWLSGRRTIAEATPAAELGEWIWTPETVGIFWNRLADTPLNAMSFGLTAGEALLAALEPWLVPGGRHLDVGAGEGEMARVLARAGYPVATFEPSTGRRRTIEDKLGGEPGYRGAFAAIDETIAGSFDVVMAFEVIEHVLAPDLAGFFATLDRALAPGGRLLITTPNREDLGAVLMVSPTAGVFYHRWQHVRTFDTAALTALLSRHGFAVEVTHEIDVSALASDASPFAALALAGRDPVRLGNGSTLVAIAHRIGERPATAPDPLKTPPRIGLRPPAAPAPSATPLVGEPAETLPPAPGPADSPPSPPPGDRRRAAVRLARSMARPLLRPPLRVARKIAQRVLPDAVKRRLVRLFIANEFQQARSLERCFADRPFPLKDLPPLLGPEAFAGGPIILVNNALAWGGAERQVVTTLRGLVGRVSRPVGLLCLRLGFAPDYDFFLPAMKDFPGIVRNTVAGGEAEAILAALPAAAVARARSAIEWLPGDVRDEVERLAADFVQLRPSVVHAWLDSPSIAAAYAARIAGVPRIIVSGRNVSPPHFAFDRPYMALAYREIADIPAIDMINNSAAGAADYAGWLGLADDRIGILRNGIDPDAFVAPAAERSAALREELGIPGDAPIVGAIFRLYDEKRPLLWAEVASLVGALRPDCHFVLVGTGPLRNEITGRAHAGGIADRLHLPGTSPETAAYLSLFDVFLLTSRVEGTPNVVLEASLAGVPVVAADGGGTAEAIDHGVTGFVVKEETAATLAARVLEVLADPLWRERARRAGPDFVNRHFGLERMLEETIALYDC